MGYQFDFDWGESWIVTENDFEWDREYWYKVLARHIHFFREKVKEQKSLDLITTVQVYRISQVCRDRDYMGLVYRDSDYMGLVSVSDHYVHVIMNDPRVELCWLVEEL